MENQFSISKAKDKLPAIVHAVEDGTTVQLTRHGKPVAVLLSITRYMNLSRQKKDFWEALTSFRNSCNSSNLLTEEDLFSETRDRTEGRKIHF
jgi:prevent-host-death family protein